MTRTLQHLEHEFEQLPDAAGGMCFNVRGPFRASMTFASREGTSPCESAEAAANGLEVEVPQPEHAESVSVNEATARLQSLLARHAATADEVRSLAQVMIGNVVNGSADESLTCACILGGSGEGLVVLGSHHTWAVWLHTDPSRPLPSRSASPP